MILIGIDRHWAMIEGVLECIDTRLNSSIGFECRTDLETDFIRVLWLGMLCMNSDHNHDLESRDILMHIYHVQILKQLDID